MYYPKSQIVPNLYTNGNEYMIKSTKEKYTGYYWKTSRDKFFTGKTPQDFSIQEIIPITDPINTEINVNNNQYVTLFSPSEYISLKQIPQNKVTLLPSYSPNIPTDKDYKVGEFKRYFCKKINEWLYIEINKDTYNKLVKKDPSIYYQFYIPFSIPWNLSGDKEKTYRVNENIVKITSRNLKLFKFNDYLQNDFAKYYKEPSNYISLNQTKTIE